MKLIGVVITPGMLSSLQKGNTIRIPISRDLEEDGMEFAMIPCPSDDPVVCQETAMKYMDKLDEGEEERLEKSISPDSAEAIKAFLADFHNTFLKGKNNG